MPVTLHHVDQPAWQADDQLRLDLTRIYADAADERRIQSVETFIARHFAEGGYFACAAFNDRLLGAVAVRETAEAWWLSELCVRKPTRRRGVGTRLMALMADEAATAGLVLRIATSSLPLADRVLLSRLGYRPVSAEPSDADATHQTSEFVELDPRRRMP